MHHPLDSTRSPWQADVNQNLNPLTSDAKCDVVVVGAGIAGMSIAYELATRGRSVIVLDDGPIGGGETSRTTAHLVNALDSRYKMIEKMHGEEAARLAAQSHTTAVDRIEAITKVENIDCDLTRVDGYLFVPPDKQDKAEQYINDEQEACSRAGVICQRLAKAPGMAIDTGPCLRFPNQAQFHPMKYLSALARAIKAQGGRIHTGSHVREFHGGKDAHVITSDGRTVSADAIVVATNTPVNDLVTMHTKQVAYRSYVVGMVVPKGAMSPALYWDGYWEDRDTHYHYVRLRLDPQSDRELLIVGGEDHRVGDPPADHDQFKALEAWTRERFPMVQETAYRWSGQIMEPFDEFAFIGRNPGRDDNVLIVTGDSGNGMTHGVIASLMFPALIAGESHIWEKIYSPSRLPRHALSEAVLENLKTVGEYRDWVTPHEKSAPKPLVAERGRGEIIREDGKLVAVYTSPDGKQTRCSAVCTHLKAVVRWNEKEQSWDCPAHGSRFDHDGKVVNGPANKDLDSINHK
jgi:glycine/D-amino acid oxidase-like deaminating enzyme/nitrite reductase/ring-hydroxylating ferredoxin subunit